MKFVPPEIIDEIREKSDIVEIISEYVSLKRQGKNYVGLCPFHLEDTPSFSVSPDKQIFYCFGCHKGGGVINFMMEHENLTLPEAAEKLAEKVGVEIPADFISDQDYAHQSEKRRLVEMHELAADFYHKIIFSAEEGKVPLQYLKERDLNLDVIKEFQLGYAPSSWDRLTKYLLTKGIQELEMEKAGLAAKSSKGHFYDKFRDRLMLPIKDFRGKVIAFGGRVLGNEFPKYLNSAETPIFTKSKNLYGLNEAASFIRQYDEAIIMEGYMDVIAAHQFGVKNAVASLGTSLTPDQVKLLKRYTSKVLIAYDADAAGAKATYRGLDILQNLGFRVRVLKLPDGLDPDDFLHKHNYQDWVQLVENSALSLVEYKMDAAMDKYNVKSIEGKGDIVSELLPDISRIKSQVEKDQYIKLLSKTLDIPMDSIYADLRQVKGIKEKTDNFSKERHIKNTQGQNNQGQVKNIFLKRDQNARVIAEKDLCKLMVENQKIFDLVEQSLGLDFSEEQKIRDTLTLVKATYEKFDWLPATLIDGTDQKELKQFISQLFMEDIPGNNNKDLLVQDYIKAIKLNRLKVRIQEIERAIHGYEKGKMTDDTIQLLQEYSLLQQQVQQLKH